MKEKLFCSVDPVVFTLKDKSLQVLLIKQQIKGEPFYGQFRLPGSVIDSSNASHLDEVASLALFEKTGVETNFFEQLKTYGGISRDPRGWSVSCAYIGVVNYQNIKENPNNQWVDVHKAMSLNLAFDHSTILRDALSRLKNKVNYSILPAHFLAEEFTLSELKGIYESILEEKLDKSSFIKKIKDSEVIEPIEGKFLKGDFRPAQMWRVKNMQHFNRNLKPKFN